MKVEDESMIVIHFKTASKGDLPNFSYILRTRETLVTDFKTVSCSISVSLKTNCEGKEGMKHSKYQHQIGATEACTNRMMESTTGIRQRYRKGATKDIF